MSTVSHSSVPHSPQATTTLTGNGVVGEARVGDVSSYYVPPQDYVQTKLPEQDQPPRSPPGHPVSMAMQEDAQTAAAAAVPGPHGDRTSVIVRNHRHDDDRDEGSAELGSIRDRAAEAPSPRATAVGVSALPPDARVGGAADSATAGSEGESESWEAARKMGDEDRAASEDKDEDAAREDAKDADAASEDAEAVSEVADAEAANKDAGAASENAKDAGEYSEVASEDAEAAVKDAEAAIKSVAAAIEDAEAAGEDAKDAEVASEDGEDETAPSFEYAKNEEVANEDAEGGSENTKDEKDADAVSKDAAEDAWEDVGDASEDESEDAKHANDYAKAANDDADAASSRRMREAAVATILRRTVDCVCGDELLDRLSRRHDDDPASSAGIAHHYRLAADMLSTLLRRVAASDDLATPEAARPCSVLVWRVDDGNVGALKRRHLLRAINLSAAASRRKTTATTNKRRSEAAANKPQSREEAASPREPLTTNKRRAVAGTAAEVAAAKEQEVSKPSEEQRGPSPDAGGRPVRSLRPRRRVPDYRTAPAASARQPPSRGDAVPPQVAPAAPARAARPATTTAPPAARSAPLRRNPRRGFLPAKPPSSEEEEDDAAATEEEEEEEEEASPIATAAAVVRALLAGVCGDDEEDEDEEECASLVVARVVDDLARRADAVVAWERARRTPAYQPRVVLSRVDDVAAATLRRRYRSIRHFDLSLARRPGMSPEVAEGSPEVAARSPEVAEEESPHLAAAHVVGDLLRWVAAEVGGPAGDESTAVVAATVLEEIVDRIAGRRDDEMEEVARSRARSQRPKRRGNGWQLRRPTLGGRKVSGGGGGRGVPQKRKPAPVRNARRFSLPTRERPRRETAPPVPQTSSPPSKVSRSRSMGSIVVTATASVRSSRGAAGERAVAPPRRETRSSGAPAPAPRLAATVTPPRDEESPARRQASARAERAATRTEVWQEMPAAEPAPPAAARGAKRAAAGGGGSSSAEKRSRTNKRRPLAVQAVRQRAAEGRRTRQTAALKDMGRKSDKGTSEEEEAESESRGRRTRGREPAARSSRQRAAPSSESRNRLEEEDAGRRRSLRSRAASPAAAPSPGGSDSDTSLSSLQSVGAVEDLSPGRAAGRSPRGATRWSQEGATRRSQEGASGWRQLRSRAPEETPPTTAGAGSVDSGARTQRARPQPTVRTTPAVTPGSRPSPGGRATRSRPAVPAPPDESPVRATRSRRGAGEEPPHEEEEEEEEKVGGRGAPTRRALRSAGAAATPGSEVIADDGDDVSRSKASKRTLVEVRPPRGRRLPPGRAVAEKSDSSAEDSADDSRRPATRRRSVAPPIAWEVVATTETGRGRTRSNSDESRRVSGIRLRAVVACDRLASDENKVKKEEEEKEEEEEEEEEEIFSKRLRNRRESRSAPKRRSLQEAGGGREEHGGGGGGEEEEDAGSHTKALHRGSDDSESVIFGKKLRTKGATSPRVGPSPKSRSLRGKPSCIKDDSAAEGAEGETKPEYGAVKSESEDSESAIFGKKLRKKTSSSRLRPSPKARSLRGKPRYGEEDSAEEEEEEEEAKAEEREDDRTASKAAKSDGDSESDSAFYAKLRQQAATTRSRRAPRRAAAAPVAERDSGVAHRSDTDDSDSETFGMHARRKPLRSKRTARPRRRGKAPHAEEDSEGEERERKPARKTRRRPGGAEPDSGSDTAGVAARSASPVSDGGVVAPVSRGAESGDDSESEIFGKLRRKAVATGGGQRSTSARASRSLSAPPRDDSDSELFGERRTEPPPPDASFDSIVSQVAPAAAAPAASRQARPATTRCDKAHRNLWPSSRRGEAADKRTSDVGDSAESPAREVETIAARSVVAVTTQEVTTVSPAGAGAPTRSRSASEGSGGAPSPPPTVSRARASKARASESIRACVEAEQNPTGVRAARRAPPGGSRAKRATECALKPPAKRGRGPEVVAATTATSPPPPQPPPPTTLCDVSFSESEGDDVGGDGGAPALQREQAWSPPAVPSSDSDTDVDDDDGDHQGAPADEDRGVAKSLAMARRQFYDLASAVVRPATFLPPGGAGADSSRDGDTESYSENDAEFGDGGGEGEGEGADTAAAGRDVGCQWEGGAEGATWPSFADLRREGESLMRRSKRATTAISTKSSQSAANFYPRI